MNRSPTARTRAFLVLTWLSAFPCAACDRGETVPITEGEIQAQIITRGRVEPSSGIASLSAPYTARVSSVLVVEGEHVEAQQELARLEGRLLEEEVIRAPFAGVILHRQVDVGDDASPAEGALFELANPDALQVQFELEGEDADRVSIGTPVRIMTPGGQTELATGSVLRLAPTMRDRMLGEGASNARGRSRVRAGVAHIEGALLIGREVEVAIALPPEHASARVPRSAIHIHEGHASIRLEGWWQDDEVAVRCLVADDTLVAIAPHETVSLAGRRVRLP